MECLLQWSPDQLLEFIKIKIMLNLNTCIGKEVITRITANMITNKMFYTDSNGRDFLKRVYFCYYSPHICFDNVSEPHICELTIHDFQQYICRRYVGRNHSAHSMLGTPAFRLKKTPCLECWKVKKDTKFMICSAASSPTSKQKIHVVVLLYLCFIRVVSCYFVGCL